MIRIGDAWVLPRHIVAVMLTQAACQNYVNGWYVVLATTGGTEIYTTEHEHKDDAEAAAEAAMRRLEWPT